MKNFSKNIALWIIIGLLLVALFNLFQNSSSNNQSKEISFSDFLIATDNGNISEVKIIGNNVSGFFEDGRSFSTYAPNYPDLVDKLNKSGVKIIAEPSERSMHPAPPGFNEKIIRRGPASHQSIGREGSESSMHPAPHGFNETLNRRGPSWRLPSGPEASDTPTHPPPPGSNRFT